MRMRGSLFMSVGLLASIAPNVSAEGLHSLAVKAGKLFFGTATDTILFNDTAYMSIVNNISEFGLLVPENSQKWEPTEPTEGIFQLTNPTRVATLARTNKQMFRCHTLTWYSQLPTFVTQGKWTRETLTAAIQSHIANVVGHFAGQCYSWDVVNEALNDNGTFRDSVFFQTLGTDFIPISFQAAARADPAAKLYYNDFSLEFNSNKTESALKIVQLVQNSGLRIDGVGFQGHMVVGGTPPQNSLVTVLNRFTALGVEVAITELDVRHSSLPASSTALEQQAKDYVSVVGACLAVAECVGVIVWEFTDKYSWIPATFPGTGEACLFDANMSRRPAYTSVSSLLAAAATGTVQSGRNGGNFTNMAGSTGTGTPPSPTNGTIATSRPTNTQAFSRASSSSSLDLTLCLGIMGFLVFFLSCWG